MNLLLGSILLFILITPGLVFRVSYLQGTYAKVNFKASAVDEIFWAIIPALIIQLSALTVLRVWFGVDVRVDVFYALITGASSDRIPFTILQQGFFPFLLYLFSLIGAAVALGQALRAGVRKFKLDIRYPLFRLNNEWHYLFSGEILDFPGVPGESENIELIQIDVLVGSGEERVIYSGILRDYYLSKDNGLDRLYLSQVYRRKLKDDLSPDDQQAVQQLDERYYQMPGELFVISYANISNMNVTYHRFSLTDETDDGEE